MSRLFRFQVMSLLVLPALASPNGSTATGSSPRFQVIAQAGGSASSAKLPEEPDAAPKFAVDATGTFNFQVPGNWNQADSLTWTNSSRSEGLAVKCVELRGRRFETWSDETLSNATRGWSKVDWSTNTMDSQPCVQVVGYDKSSGQTVFSVLLLQERSGRAAVLIGSCGTNDFKAYAGRFVAIRDSFRWVR